jgi:magnesium chelatase subunit I
VFRRRVVLEDPQAVIGSFTVDTVVHAGDDLPASAYAGTLSQMPALSGPVLGLTGGSEDPGVVASAVEFLLEGLHLTKRLNKEAAGPRAIYRGRG